MTKMGNVQTCHMEKDESSRALPSRGELNFQDWMSACCKLDMYCYGHTGALKSTVERILLFLHFL